MSKNCSTDGLRIDSTDRAFGSFVSCLIDDERSIFEKKTSFEIKATPKLESFPKKILVIEVEAGAQNKTAYSS